MRVLLFGGSLQGLSCGASLSKEGIIVDAFTDNLQVRKSTFFRRVYPFSIEKQSNSIFSILESNVYDVIIPMGDVGTSFLSKNRKEIESDYSCVCACPDIKLLKIVEDKNRFMHFCELNDIPHPRTVTLCDEALEKGAGLVGFPALIKPNFSVGARGITRVNSLEELKEQYAGVKKKFGACTLQEFIDNKEYYYNVMLYRDKKGDIIAHTIIKIVRMYPIEAGSSTCCISIEDNNLLTICKNCLDKLGWVGMADFDVLQRLDTGDYKIIEINPRVPASLRAAQISGVNFPLIISYDAIGEPTPHMEYLPGKVMRYLGTDIMWFLKTNRRFKTKPSWFKFIGKDLYYQDIYLKDPSTWWTWLAVGIKKFFNRNKRIR